MCAAEFKKIDSTEYPLEKGESWWIIHPNSSGGEFLIPEGASTVCVNDFLSFKAGTIYKVALSGSVGWVVVIRDGVAIEMPQYLFARNFDAEIFIRGIKNNNITEQINFNTKSWLDSYGK